MTVLFDAAAILSVCGMLICISGWLTVWHFVTRPPVASSQQPPVTILKPLCGDEPLLEAALASCCAQLYPTFQIVFGCHSHEDPALAVVDRLRVRYPDCDIVAAVDPTIHGPNRKVSNLINMLPSARYDLLVICDSDLHVPQNYLQGLVAGLGRPGTGLVTSAYVGIPPAKLGWKARLGATQIDHTFLPGVLLSRALGRQDCLGSSVMLRRDTLERAGGLRALVRILAEDNVLGQRVRALGLSIGLSDIIVATTVPEATLRALWYHEIRWMRTVRVSAPLALAASTLQYPMFWATLAVALTGGNLQSAALFGAGWGVRASCAIGIDRVLRRRFKRAAPSVPLWLLPLRDVLSVVEIATSYWTREVVWRGNRMNVSGLAADRVPV